MPRTVVMVQTLPHMVGTFQRLAVEELPDVRVLQVLDEPMLERIKRRGFTTVDDENRLAEHIRAAEAVEADVVLVTCSTVSLCVGAIRDGFRVPVLKIDEPMAAEAVRVGRRIALLATAPTTLEPSRALLLSEAAAAGRSVEISMRLVDDAIAALLSGDGVTHDRLLEAAIREEAGSADVIVLAQASMARVLDAMTGRPVSVPVLTSPHAALRAVARLLASGPTAAHHPRGEVRP